jgi:hypothetical protein
MSMCNIKKRRLPMQKCKHLHSSKIHQITDDWLYVGALQTQSVMLTDIYKLLDIELTTGHSVSCGTVTIMVLGQFSDICGP